MKTSLKTIDDFDIDFVCKVIENSLKIRYNNDELTEISTLGDFYDLTISIIQAENIETCTHQEAFYKIRNAFAETLHLSEDNIFPKILISTILPRKNRIKNLKKIEKRLGFKLNILSAPNWIVGTLILILIVGTIFLFIIS